MVIKPRIQRHFADKGARRGSSSSDSDSSDDEQPRQQKKKTPAPPPKVASAGKIISSGSAPIRKVPPQLQEQSKRPTTEELERKAAEEGFVTEEEESGNDAAGPNKGGNDEGSSSEEEDSDDDEEEESSEDERPRRNLMIRPKFIPKSQRNGGGGGAQGASSTEQKADPEKAEREEAARKQAEADAMIEEQIRKDQAARKAGRMFWEDGDEGLQNQGSDVDTDDDADPEADAAAWKVRELRRIKRDREAVEAREREMAEVERRRGLTAEERAAEDEAHLARQRDEKEGRGKMAFMGKYFHKGAFFQDSEEAGQLAARDVMGARFEDDVDRSLLPKALQMRDAAKLGRKGASKYRDLKSEDTGRWGEFRDHRPGREMRDGDWRGNKDRDGPGGANAIPLGDRRDRGGADRNSSHRPRDDRRDDDHRRRRSDSRSRSPRRDRDQDDYGHRRKRDSSREADRYVSDKRRRVDSR